MEKDNDNNEKRRHHRPWRNLALRHGEHVRRLQMGQRGFLRPEILQLLEEKPMNGVDIMNKMHEMSHGWYRPSPGSIYPLFEQLQKEGLIAKNKEGKYELTAIYDQESGTTDDVGHILTAMESNVSYFEELQKTAEASPSSHLDRIEMLARRLEVLNGELQPRRDS
jgi:DNA-binding PadR family transcriptional regulator